MIISLYAVKDDLAEFFFFANQVNDEVAARNFKVSCEQNVVPYKDLSLYRIGMFDTVTGNITDTKLEFICRGEKYEKD